MFGDLYCQRATYVEGTFYAGRFRYLKPKNESSIEPPDLFLTKRHRNLLKAKQSNQGRSKDKQMKFHMNFPQKRHEPEEIDHTKKFRKAATLVKNVVSFDHFSSLNQEDWQETVQAGVRLWINRGTGEVSAECPWKAVEERGGNLQELQLSQREHAAVTALAVLTKSQKLSSKEHKQLSMKLRQQVQAQRKSSGDISAAAVAAVTASDVSASVGTADRRNGSVSPLLSLEAVHFQQQQQQQQQQQLSPAQLSPSQQQQQLQQLSNLSSSQLLQLQENELLKSQAEKHRRIQEYLESHTVDLMPPSSSTRTATAAASLRPFSAQSPLLSPESRRGKFSFVGKGASPHYRSPYTSFRSDNWTATPATTAATAAAGAVAITRSKSGDAEPPLLLLLRGNSSSSGVGNLHHRRLNNNNNNCGSRSADLSEAQRRSVDYAHNHNHQQQYGRLPLSQSLSKNQLITEAIVGLPSVVAHSQQQQRPTTAAATAAALAAQRPKTSHGRLERDQQQQIANAAAAKAAADRMRARNDAFGDNLDETGAKLELGTGALVYDNAEFRQFFKDLDALK